MTSRTYLDAALTVLRAAERPMTSDEVTQEAIRQGLIVPTGKTPKATMAARLYVEVQRNPETPLVRLAEPGKMRTRRGSVRWTARPDGQATGG